MQLYKNKIKLNFEKVKEEFQKHITDKLEFLTKSKILVAISGGIDSVVLTHLCKQLKFNLALAHCNFNLRGNESETDQDSVLELAKNLNLEAFVQRFDTKLYAKDNKLSIQMAARELRYNWFSELAVQLDFDYILTAHHADDNLETVLINFIRGTGLEGLTGIPEVNGKYVRPLLPFSSESIEVYAKQNNIKWRDDSSNKSVKYLRNKLRHEVVPILKEINPSLLQSFNTTLNHLNESSAIVAERIDEFLKKAIESIGENEVKFKISEFKKLKNPKSYLFESLKEFGFREWNDVLALLDADTGKQVFSNTHRLIKNREHLLLSEINLHEKKSISVAMHVNKIEIPLGTLLFDEADASFSKRSEVIYVDKDMLEFPLTIRQYKTGDFFYPLGMHGKKKVSKYFKDEKLSLLDKENTWLLCSGNAIVWIINRRADNRFKVTEKTKHILKIRLD